jgi:hypothetical protein
MHAPVKPADYSTEVFHIARPREAFGALLSVAIGDCARRYTSSSCRRQEPHVASGSEGRLNVEAHISAEQSAAVQAPRLPATHAYTCGPDDHRPSSREGPLSTVGVTRVRSPRVHPTSVASSRRAGRFTETGWYCLSLPARGRSHSWLDAASGGRSCATGPGASCGPRGGSSRPRSRMATTSRWSLEALSKERARATW